MILFISFMYHKGKEQGCVAMGTGASAGLWDVISCQETANFLCKQQAVEVPLPALPAQVPAAACAQGWDGAPHADSCFKVSAWLPCQSEHVAWHEGTQMLGISGELSPLENSHAKKKPMRQVHQI